MIMCVSACKWLRVESVHVSVLYIVLFGCRICALGAGATGTGTTGTGATGTVCAVKTSLDVFIFINSKFSLLLSVIWPSWVSFYFLAPDRGHMNSDLLQ